MLRLISFHRVPGPKLYREHVFFKMLGHMFHVHAVSKALWCECVIVLANVFPIQ